MGTGIMNSSDDYGGNMANTPASDKASKMSGEKEPTPAGLKKNTMPEKEPKSPGTKQNMMKPPKNGFMPGSRGR